MSRQLMLLRHGKSDWSKDVRDFDRPLKKRGKRAAQRMGAWMQQQGLIPDYIISSPAERARNTAAKLIKAMGQSADRIHLLPQLYAAELDSLKQALAYCPATAKKILLIGHNPELEALLTYLNSRHQQRPKDGKLLPTATLAVLAMPDNWEKLNQGCARLISITRPPEVPEKFNFNGLTGAEKRLRPAYYYSQSAAVPYRLEKNELQLLLVSSSANNHWVVPKGIIEPGLTGSASAAIEAWEEAGIEGDISEQMLGYYSYDKWGGTCTVQVYPMAVTHIIADSDWQENHRNRQWFSLKKACSLVKEHSLAPMFTQLADLLSMRTD